MSKSKNESNNKNSGTLFTEKDGTQYFVMACPKPCRVTIKFIIVPWTEYNTSFDDTLLLFLQKSNYLW